MQIFQDTFETRERSFISAFSICVTVPLMLIGDLTIGAEIISFMSFTLVFDKNLIAISSIKDVELEVSISSLLAFIERKLCKVISDKDLTRKIQFIKS